MIQLSTHRDSSQFVTRREVIMQAPMKTVTQRPWLNNLTATPSSTNNGTRITASGSTNTKGSYSTLTTATQDVFGFWLVINGTGTAATRTDMLLDIAIDSDIIMPDLLVGWRGTMTAGPYCVYLPFYIPDGSVIRARCAAAIASDTVDVVIFLNQGFSRANVMGPLFTKADAYGITSASSQGTAHTPGNSGSESTAANIGSTLSRNYGAVMLGVGGSTGTTTMTSIAYHWELQISSTTICEWIHTSFTTEIVYGPYPSAPFYTSLPSGSQLQIRGEGSGTSIAHDVAFYCFY